MNDLRSTIFRTKLQVEDEPEPKSKDEETNPISESDLHTQWIEILIVLMDPKYDEKWPTVTRT